MIRDSHTMLVPPQRPVFAHPHSSPSPHSHSHSLSTPHHLATPPLTHSSTSFFPQTPRSIPPITPSSTSNNNNLLNPISRPNSINPCSRSNSSKSNINANKKLSASTNTKHKAVQLALEQKVDKAKGFHAFFVPLARPVPNAPPSSPVLHPQCSTTTTMAGQKERDYFGKWHEQVTGPKGSQQWVEDVDDSMQLDSD